MKIRSGSLCEGGFLRRGGEDTIAHRRLILIIEAFGNLVKIYNLGEVWHQKWHFF